MENLAFRIALLEEPTDWRDKLVAALREEGHAVTLVNEAQEILPHAASSGDEKAFDLIIIAERVGLTDGWQLVGAMHAEKMAAKHREDQLPGAHLVFLSASPMTSMQLEKLAAQEVKLMLHRKMPLARVVADIGRLTFGERRGAQRYGVKWRAGILFGDQFFRGTMVDLSETGCQVVLARGQDATPLTVGVSVKVKIAHPVEGDDCICEGVVRRHRRLKVLFSSRVSLGVSFHGDGSSMLIADLVNWAKTIDGHLRRAMPGASGGGTNGLPGT